VQELARNPQVEFEFLSPPYLFLSEFSASQKFKKDVYLGRKLAIIIPKAPNTFFLWKDSLLRSFAEGSFEIGVWFQNEG
jgi:hypothetical protein